MKKQTDWGESAQVTNAPEAMSKSTADELASVRFGEPEREDLSHVAKRKKGAIHRCGPPPPRGRPWKNLVQPGSILWKEPGTLIHTVNSRVLDEVAALGRYSPALTLGARSTSPRAVPWATGPLSMQAESCREGCPASIHRCGWGCGQPFGAEERSWSESMRCPIGGPGFRRP